MCSLEPLFLLFQTPRSGNKPLVSILLLRVSVRCDVVWTVIFDGVGWYDVLLGLLLDPDQTMVGLSHYAMVVRAVVQPELPFYLDREVVGPPHYPDRMVVIPHYAREVWDLVPPHRTEVAVCASGNSWLGA